MRLVRFLTPQRFDSKQYSIILAKVVVIGSGFAGMSAACYMARDGHEVTLWEKNSTVGGRARRFERDGYRFDMGPTFYWMPDLFDRFFADFGRRREEFYRIRRLDPGYRIYFGPDDSLSEPSDAEALRAAFERIEQGSGRRLDGFLRSAAYNYRVAMDKAVRRTGDSPWELVMPETVARSGQFLRSLRSVIESRFRDERLRRMLEFPVLFLGAEPARTPSFYRFMNYADMRLGTWHVEGGMYEVALAVRRLAESLGVRIRTGAPVERIVVRGGRVRGIVADGMFDAADAVISGADYHHTETLLPEALRNYPERYWRSRTFAPSALLYYIGFDRRLKRVDHHTLFFDAPFDAHARQIYRRPGWPERPLFYASFPAQSDPTMAPAGCEAAVVLIPTAAGLIDTPEIRARYFDHIVARMEEVTGQELRSAVRFTESYAARNFIADYNACAGNAYGLANTLRQTAFLKPKVRNRRLDNLFYCGQLTVPGPGVPTALISGEIAARCAAEALRRKRGVHLGPASCRAADSPIKSV